jgi:hypothetical protein
MPEVADSVGYAAHIRPLFQEHDRLEMEFLFDLWSYEDVREKAHDIHDRVSDGTMPCDRPWPTDRVELFARWVEDGCRP